MLPLSWLQQHNNPNTRRVHAAPQLDGVRWLFWQYSQGKGGVLADDMGMHPMRRSLPHRGSFRSCCMHVMSCSAAIGRP